MTRSQGFQPDCDSIERLETRLALSGGNLLGASALVQTLHAPSRAVRAPRPSMSSMIDAAYNSFEAEYDQVRATYFNSVKAKTASTNDTTAFQKYTEQRVNLLAQDVSASLLSSFNKSLGKGSKSSGGLSLIVARINAPASNSAIMANGGSLLTNLTGTIPAHDASDTTVAIATSSQDEAIQASRVATQNGLSIVRNGYFGTGKNHRS